MSHHRHVGVTERGKSEGVKVKWLPMIRFLY